MKTMMYLLGMLVLPLTIVAEDASEPYGPTRVKAELKVDVEKGTDVVHFVRDCADPDVVTRTYVLKHADPYEIRKYLREIVQTRKIDEAETGISSLRYQDGRGVVLVSAEDYRFDDFANGESLDSIIAFLDRPDVKSITGQENFMYVPKHRAASELKKMVVNAGANVADDVTENIGGEDRIQVDHELNVLFCRTTSFSRKTIESQLKALDVPYPEVNVTVSLYELYAENDATLGVDFQSWKNNDGIELLNAGVRARTNYGTGTQEGLVAGLGAANTRYYNFNPKWNTKYIDFLVSKGKADIVHRASINVRNHCKGEIRRMTQVFNPENSDAENTQFTEEYIYVAEGTFVSQPPQWRTPIGGWVAEELYVLNALSTTNKPITIVGAAEKEGPTVSLSILKINKNYQTQYYLELIGGGEFMVDSVRVGSRVEARAADVWAYTAQVDNAVGTYTWEGEEVPYDTVNNIPEQKGKILSLNPSESFGFEMFVTPVIGEKSTMVEIEMTNSSLIGFRSDGSPRVQRGNTIASRFRVDNGGTRWVIGGLEKKDIVRTVTGIPILKDLPLVGYLFSTEGESTKKSKLLVVAEVTRIHPNTVLPEKIQEKKNEFTKDLDKAGERNTFGYRQYLIDSRETKGDE